MGKPQFLRANPSKTAKASISIIIPARNEEAIIGTLLNSIKQQSFSPLEVIVANDNSEDATAEIAQSVGATVMDVPPLPDGWKGKPWACFNAAQKAKGDYLLFVDADTQLESKALEAMAQHADQPSLVLSICPFHTIEKPYEELSSFFNLLMVAGSNAFGRTNDSSALFGQCMLISKIDYAAVGGHESVKFETLENFRLAELLELKGIKRRCLLGKGSINMRMFPESLQQLSSSWKKGFTNGAANTNPKALLYSSIWISGAMFSIVSLLLLPLSNQLTLGFSLLAYLIYAIQCVWLFRLIGNFSLWNALLYPISLLFYQWTFFAALREKKAGRTTNWKGREVA